MTTSHPLVFTTWVPRCEDDLKEKMVDAVTVLNNVHEQLLELKLHISLTYGSWYEPMADAIFERIDDITREIKPRWNYDWNSAKYESQEEE